MTEHNITINTISGAKEKRDLNVVKSVVKSALRPGVELGLDDGSVNVVARLSDIARGEVAGYNASVLGSYRQLFPRLSRKDYAMLSYTELPDSPVKLSDLLYTIPGLREEDIESWSKSRRLARQQLEDGDFRDIVVPNLKELATEMDLADYDEMAGIELEDIPDLRSRARERVYTLTQVMSDMDVKQKYKLPMRVYVTGERLAATDAPAAAQIFQDAMNSVQDHTRVVVNAGALAVDNVQASNSIRMVAYGMAPVPSSIRTDTVLHKVFLYAPPESEVDWHVVGPWKRMADVLEVYRIVCTLGPVFPSGLLAVDLVQLKIDIFDGDSYMEPIMQFNTVHDGEPVAASGLSEASAREMTSTQRALLAKMSDRLLPVMSFDGRQLATAVRVTDKHVLVNDHVQAVDTRLTVSGRKLSFSSRVSRDVWAAECPGSATPWVYRTPEVGEQAILVYIAGDGVVSCSSPVVVQTVSEEVVMTTGSPDVVGGVSGGALVSLRDFSLFATHSASVGASLLNYRFGPEQLGEIIGSDGVSSVSRVEEEDGFGAVLVKRFSDRGLGPSFRAVCSSVLPLWHKGVHFGMAVADGGRAFSVIPGESESVFESWDGSQTYLFGASAESGLSSAPCPWLDSKVPLRRPPRLGEKVFIIGYDSDLYVTHQTEVVHVYPGKKGFVLRHIPGLDKPVAGGAVVAFDGAVVGLAGLGFSMNTPVGYGLNCRLMVEKFEFAVPSARHLVRTRFPYLSVDSWPPGLLEEVFTHASVGGGLGATKFNVGNKPLAVLGDSYLKYLNSKVMRDYDVPHSEWASHQQRLQSNHAMVAAAVKFGLDKCLAVGGGTVLPPEAKAYADLLEALVGAASLCAGPEDVMRAAVDLGMIYEDEGGGSVVGVSEAAVD